MRRFVSTLTAVAAAAAALAGPATADPTQHFDVPSPSCAADTKS
jgi:hypothetical protein